MKTIVQKYGGTSVADADCIRNVARRVARSAKEGNRVAVVVSAMAGQTDVLIDLANSITDKPCAKDLDLLMATGEQASVALLSLALKGEGVETETFLGFQAGVLTDDRHGRARIEGIDPTRVERALGEGKVAVVAGFQGTTSDGAITTIGRGGSDTTAVALAAALKADCCEICSDVDGVYSADPRICDDATVLKRITYEEMMELADAGAKVLHSRSVEVAAKFGVPLEVRSSFNETEGTWVVPESGAMEGPLISGITCNTGEAKVAIRRVPDRVGVTAEIFKPIAKAGIDVDLIIQNVHADGHTDLTFTVPKDDLRRAMTLAEGAAREVRAGKVEAAGDIAKVSAVGLGMRSHAGVAHRMFAALAREGIAIQMIGTSEVKVSIVIDIRHAELAVRTLHEAFGLSAEK